MIEFLIGIGLFVILVYILRRTANETRQGLEASTRASAREAIETNQRERDQRRIDYLAHHIVSLQIEANRLFLYANVAPRFQNTRDARPPASGDELGKDMRKEALQAREDARNATQRLKELIAVARFDIDAEQLIVTTAKKQCLPEKYNPEQLKHDIEKARTKLDAAFAAIGSGPYADDALDGAAREYAKLKVALTYESGYGSHQNTADDW